MTDAGARAIASAPHFEELASLELKWNYLSEEGAAAVRARFGLRANVSHQRSLEPAISKPLAPPPPAPPASAKKKKKVDRVKALTRLGARRAFRAWSRGVKAHLIEAAEAIHKEAIDSLLALGAKPTPAAERNVLRRYVTRFNALDAGEHFLGTIEVEDIAERFDAIRFLTALDTDDDLFDAWRDF